MNISNKWNESVGTRVWKRSFQTKDSKYYGKSLEKEILVYYFDDDCNLF